MTLAFLVDYPHDSLSHGDQIGMERVLRELHHNELGSQHVAASWRRRYVHLIGLGRSTFMVTHVAKMKVQRLRGLGNPRCETQGTCRVRHHQRRLKMIELPGNESGQSRALGEQWWMIPKACGQSRAFAALWWAPWRLSEARVIHAITPRVNFSKTFPAKAWAWMKVWNFKPRTHGQETKG